MKKRFLMIVLVFVSHLVQAGCTDDIEASTPNKRFSVDENNGIVIDNKTHLVWMRCAIGQSGRRCTGNASRYNWKNALETAERIQFNGEDDWRLPNIKELASIVEAQCNKPAINSDIFPETPSGWYWSSSPTAKEEQEGQKAWSMSFKTGYDTDQSKDKRQYIRLVRGG